MRLQSIQLVDFISHKNSLIHFHPNLTIVIGPNGAGKTAILDATKFAAGSTTKERADRFAKLIRRGKQRARVFLNLVDETGELYTVERVMKESYRTSRINKRQRGVKEVNKWFKNHKFNPDSPVCVLVQGEATWPFQAKPEKRFNFFEESLGIRQMRLELLNKIKTLEEKNNHLGILEEEKNAVKVTLDDWREREKQFHKRKEILFELDSLELEKKWVTLHTFEKSLIELQAKETKIFEEISSLEANPFLSEVNNVKMNLEECIQVINQINTDIKLEERSIKLIQQNLRSHREDKKKKDETVTKRQEQLKKVQNRINKKRIRMERLEKKINGEKHEIEDIFGKERTARDIIKEIKHWEGQREFVLERIQKLSTDKARLNGQKQILERDIEDLHQKINQITEQIYEFLDVGDYEIDDPERLEKETWEGKKDLDIQIGLIRTEKRKIQNIIKELELKKNAKRMYTGDELEFLGRIKAGKYLATEGPLCEAIQVAKGDHILINALIGEHAFGFVVKSKTELLEILKIGSSLDIELTVWYEPWFHLINQSKQNDLLRMKLKDLPTSFQQILAKTTPKEIRTQHLTKIIDSPPQKGVLALDPQKGICYQDGVFSTIRPSRLFFDMEQLRDQIIEKQTELEIIEQNEESLLNEVNKINDELNLISKCKSQLLERQNFRRQIDGKENQLEEIKQQIRIFNERIKLEKEEKGEVEKNLNKWKELRKILEQIGEKEEKQKNLFIEIENEKRGASIIQAELEKDRKDLYEVENRVKRTEKRLNDVNVKILKLKQENQENERKKERLNQKINELHKRELELQIQLTKARNQLKAVLEDIDYYKVKIKDIKLKLTDLDRPKIRQSHMEIEKRIRELTFELSSLEDAELFNFHKLIDIEEEFTDVSNQIEKKKREIQAFQIELKHASDEWKNRIQEILHAINTSFSNYVRLMGAANGKIVIEGLEEDEPKLKILGQFDSDNLTTGETASGGEKTLLTLGFMFAIQDHLEIPFCLLDEFQLSLDGIRLENAINMITEVSKKRQF
ncbi:MAG: AAA family ATPase, partial [Promethearchaeota archaeon]